MAGIGFELKKLFNKKGLINNLKAVSYSSIVTIGPTVICMGAVIIFNFLMKYFGVSSLNRELFQSQIMYEFIFSLLLTSGYTMVLTRYISDKMYTEKFSDIKSSLYGSISVITIIGSLLVMIFYIKSPMDISYKFCGYILFIELIIESVLCTYISCLKDYKIVTVSFIAGFTAALMIGIIFMIFTNINKVLVCMMSFNIGMLIIIISLYYQIEKFFGHGNKNYFGFLKYFKKYVSLFFVNTFYFLGLYIHNFIFWSDDNISISLENTYIFCPIYDIPAFFALIAALPCTIMFIVKVETSFAQKFKRYFDGVNNGASYKDIQTAKEDMIWSLKRETSYLMIVQLFITCTAILTGQLILPLFGFTSTMIKEFYILALAYYGIQMIMIFITILLYFEQRNAALQLAINFVLTNTIFTYITLNLGDVYYGFGVFISAYIAMIFGIFKIKNYLKNIDYYVFCKNCRFK